MARYYLIILLPYSLSQIINQKTYKMLLGLSMLKLAQITRRVNL